MKTRNCRDAAEYHAIVMGETALAKARARHPDGHIDYAAAFGILLALIEEDSRRRQGRRGGAA